jgi:hypothetical protein
MWHDALRFFVEQTVTINHAMIRVGQQREVLSGFVVEFVTHVLGFVVWVNADGEDFDLGVRRVFQQ